MGCPVSKWLRCKSYDQNVPGSIVDLFLHVIPPSLSLNFLFIYRKLQKEVLNAKKGTRSEQQTSWARFQSHHLS